MSLFIRVITFVCLVFGALLVVGCDASDATSVCDAALDCGSLTQAQYDACVADAQRFEIMAEKTGCDVELQSAVDCSGEEGICQNGQYTAYTCDSEWQQFQSCAGD